MNKLVTALTLAALLSGCASTDGRYLNESQPVEITGRRDFFGRIGDWIHEHPKTTTFIAASLILSAGQIDGKHNEPSFKGPWTKTPAVDCAGSPEACR